MKGTITTLVLFFSIWVAAQGPNLEKDYAAVESKVIEWRHDIHQNPELSNREFKTAEKIANHWACRDIGGDTQYVSSLDMKLSEETFKHILLPVYISSYVYNNKKYRFYVNGQTGVISGNRPYSFWKIFFTVLLVLAVIGTIAIIAQQ